jgi:hypothetical protein
MIFVRRMMDEKIDVGPNSSSDQGGLFSIDAIPLI